MRGCLRLTTLLAAVASLWLGWKAVTWPDVAALAKTDPETTAFIERFKASRRAQGQNTEVAWRWVRYDAISPHLKRAVLVSEDIEFFDHEGFAVEEIKAAVRDAVRRRKMPRGASTITQQLAKNLWLSPSRNPLRKLEEALLTRQLERHLEKRRLLEIYLNIVELGTGIYGAEAGARHYFGKSAAALNEAEAAQLAASLPRPSHWYPGSASRVYRQRVARIRQRMDKATFLRRLI
ncbi:MAG: monofunctional biosynthetic peptidoglycan transglycosylase [Acidobacteriota bacterium]